MQPIDNGLACGFRPTTFFVAAGLAAMALMICGSRADTVTNEAQVPPYSLPDPLLCQDGTKIKDVEMWKSKRRPELVALFENEMYGKTLVGRPKNLRFIIREKKVVRDGRALRLRVGILFEGNEAGRKMELLVVLPTNVQGPVPVFLGANFDGNYTTTTEPDLPLPKHWVMGLHSNGIKDHLPAETDRGLHQHLWPYAYALEHGYGVATLGYGEVEPDEEGRWRDGPRGLGPEPGNGDWGSIGAWAWALSRAMDYLESNPQVDKHRVIVIGFSRLGKVALWSAAQDERFAMIVSNCSGAGGAALSKRIFGETVQDMISHHLGHWFAPNFKKYASNEGALPVDQHELLALLAPRPLLITSGTEDLWSDPKGEFLGGMGADPVYRLYGTDGLSTHEWPKPSHLIDSTIGYFLRPGKHDVTLEDWQAMVSFADKHLRRPRSL